MKNQKTKNEPYCCSESNLSHTRTFIFLFSLIFFSTGFSLQAQNDLCTDATAIACGETLSGSTTLATADAAGTCGTSNTAPGVWYSFIGNGDDITASLCSGTNYDSKLSVFSGSCGALVCVDGDDDGCGAQSEVSFTSTAGTTYLILVHGFSSNTGDFDLEITCTPAAVPPANDACADAIAIGCGETLAGTTVAAASDAAIAGTCGFSVTAPGVWYSFIGNGDDVTASLCVGTTYDSKLSVYEGTCAALVCVDGDDDFCGTQSQVTFTSVAATEYFILVHGFSSNSGAFELSVSSPACASAPANDECANALPITCGQTLTGTTIGATADPVGFCGTSASAPGVWYSYTGTGDDVILNTCSNPNYDTKISVFEGSCAALVCVDGNDDGCGAQSSISFTSVAGTNYFIYVHGFASEVGNFDLSLTCLSPCALSQLQITITTDDFGEETSFDLVNLTSNTSVGSVAEGSLASNTTFDYFFCIDASDCYGFTISDFFGDGICCSFGNGSYTVTLDGITIASGGSFGASESTSFGTCATPNDNCVDATVVTDGIGQAFSNFGATTDGSAEALCLSFGNDQIFSDIWYSYTASCTGVATFSTVGGTSYDTRAAVYTSPCPGTIIACNDDDAGTFQSTLFWNVTAGTTYLIRLGGFDPVAQGTGTFNLSCSGPGQPNDFCADAIAVSCGSTVTGSTVGALAEGVDCGVSITASGVWYKVAGTGEVVTATTCNLGNLFDTKLSVYEGNCNALVCVNGNDDDAGCAVDPFFSTVSFLAATGTDYYILVHGFGTNTGTFELSLSCAPALVNDDCSGATPVTLTNGTAVTLTGTTSGATASADESNILGAAAVWEAITLTGVCNNLTVNFCGTGIGIMETAFIITTDCPVTGFTAGEFEFTSCGDGNITFSIFNIPAGTYYLPVLADGSFNTLGSYTMTVLSEDCPPIPVNDDCASITPVTLTNGTPVTFTGTTVGATASAEEANLLGATAVWEAVTLTGACNFLTIDYCGTGTGIMETAFIVVADCPTTGFARGEFEFTSCGDGNITILFTDVPPGTYYIPVLADRSFNTLGDYTMTVLSEDCPVAPANDNVCSAQALAIGVPTDFYNFSATAETGEVFPGAGTDPNGGCNSQDGWCDFAGLGEPGVTNTVWFTFVAPASGSVVIEAGSFDGQLAVYSVGDCNDFSTFTLLAANDDRGGFDVTPRITSLSCFGGNPLTPGQTYYIQFDGFAGEAGFGTIVVNELVCPANDDVCTPEALTLGVAAAFDNSFASAQLGEITPGAGTNNGNTCNATDGWCSFDIEAQNSLWYTFVAPASGHVSIVAGDFDLQLAAYSVSNCADFTAFTELGGNDDGNPSGTFSPALELNCLTPGQTYYVQLDGFGGASGGGGILVSDAGPGDVITAFTLINANTDTDLGTLNDGDTLNLYTLPGINIRVDLCIPVGSVVFQLNGITQRIESAAPYALAGDNPIGNYQTWYTTPGNYQLIATPYAASRGGGGAVGTPDTINFVVINSRVDCAGTANGTAVQDVNGDCCQTADLDCAGVCFGGATQIDPYLRVVNTSTSWRKLKLGNNPNSLWTPAVDVTAGGTNNMLCVTLRAVGTVDWSKILIRVLGSGVAIGSYGAPSASFSQVCIPLSAFGGANFSALTVLEIPYSNGHGAFEIHIQRVEFTGGANPYVWFGAPKTNNAHDGQSGGGSSLFAELVAPPCGGAAPKWSEDASSGIIATTESETMMMDVYPNPFSYKVFFEFVVGEDSPVSLQLYSVTGEKLVTVFEGTATGGQLYRQELNTSLFASGFYLYKLQTKDEVKTEKILLAR